MAAPADDDVSKDAYTTAKPSRFHFKSSASHRKRRHDRHDDSAKRHRSDDESSSRHSHRSSRRKHRHAHPDPHPDAHPDRHPTSTADGSYYDPDARHRESLFDHVQDNDQAAFRESLFDALADDEGAAYWEAVYGQPINVYPLANPGPDGTLERMTEDEYAAFVRARMWEKTHQHVVEEREARERARREAREQHRRCEADADADDERDSIRRQMEESLKRGEERKRLKDAAKSWHLYTAKWETLNHVDGAAEGTLHHVRDLIPWPVLSGEAKHVDKHEVERFLRAAPLWKADASALLKAERVRWHPDKMQRRFGSRIDEDTIRLVTAVFQVIDHMWSARLKTS